MRPIAHRKKDAQTGVLFGYWDYAAFSTVRTVPVC